MSEIAGYQLGRLLGQGAYGETYKAEKNGELVALKLIKEEAIQQGFDLRRFQREVRALQKVVGPNVVRLLDSGIGQSGNENRYYIALEYLEGRDLAKAFRALNFQLDEEIFKSILIQILDGLETVHEQHIVHRDLKPANVFLMDDSTVKLLDFGLVRMLDYTTLTSKPGQAIGTPLFIAPEILRAEAVDYRADFYSFGVLMYHLATNGKYPFSGLTPLELYAQVVHNPPTPPTKYNSNLSSEFENIILSLLAKHPYQRRLNHAELRELIEATEISLSSAGYSPSTVRQKIFTKRCFFNLLTTEKSEIDGFMKTGGSLDGIMYPAHFLPTNQNTIDIFHAYGIPYFFDPVTYRLAYSTFSQTQSLVDLPYVFDKNNILTTSALQTLQSQQDYVKACLDWQLRWKPNVLLSPFHFARDPTSQWIDIDIKLLEESISYARSIGSNLPVYAGLSLNIEAYTDEVNRYALLNRYSRARAHGHLFYVDTLDERTTNPLQIRSYLELLKLFQQLGGPVIAGRVGTLGLGLLAAGVDGMTSGIASLSGFSESNLLAKRAVGYDMTKKYYIPRMMLSLSETMAQDILSDSRNEALRCNCQDCQTSDVLGKVSKKHFLRVRTQEINHLNTLKDTPSRLAWFNDRVSDAVKNCEAVRKQGVVQLTPTYYAHLRVWQQVFSAPPGVTP